MLKETYNYIAVIHYADDGISISFPDLPGCFSCADGDDDVFSMAQEAMGLHLWSMEQDGDKIPVPSTLSNIKLEENEVAIMINVFMPTIRNKINNKVVKKTLTIPQWINVEAEHAGVNFSQLLQKALKEYLGIEREVSK